MLVLNDNPAGAFCLKLRIPRCHKILSRSICRHVTRFYYFIAASLIKIRLLVVIKNVQVGKGKGAGDPFCLSFFLF